MLKFDVIAELGMINEEKFNMLCEEREGIISVL